MASGRVLSRIYGRCQSQKLSSHITFEQTLGGCASFAPSNNPTLAPSRSNCVSVAPLGSVRCFSSSSSVASGVLDLSGIFPPIPTPFVNTLDDADAAEKGNHEDIDWERLQSNLAKWSSYPLKGFVVQGSNGEVAYLTDEERVAMVQAVRDAVPRESGKIIIAGAGCESTRATISMCSRMSSAGADALLVVTPSYYKGGMSVAALAKHFKQVADNSPKPVILYSVPGNTGIDLSPEVIIKLCSHPNVIGVKDSGGDISKTAFVLGKTKAIRGDEFQFLAGSASFLLPTLQLGGVGGIAALANVLPEEVCHLHSLFLSGDLSSAASLQRRLVEPNDAVTKRFGVAGLKAALDWFGFAGGRPRAPLLPITKEQFSQLKKAFHNNEFYAGKYRGK